VMLAITFFLPELASPATMTICRCGWAMHHR
jgi:hypothetical protein